MVFCFFLRCPWLNCAHSGMLHSAQVSRQSCPWPLKLMTSQRVERTWIRTVGSGANGLNDSVIKGLQYTLKNYYEKKKTKTKKKTWRQVLVILQQTSPTNFQFWCSFGKVQIMCQKCLKKTDSEKHLGQSLHECIGLAMDSITLLFFIISSTQDFDFSYAWQPLPTYFYLGWQRNLSFCITLMYLVPWIS